MINLIKEEIYFINDLLTIGFNINSKTIDLYLQKISNLKEKINTLRNINSEYIARINLLIESMQYTDRQKHKYREELNNYENFLSMIFNQESDYQQYISDFFSDTYLNQIYENDLQNEIPIHNQLKYNIKFMQKNYLIKEQIKLDECNNIINKYFTEQISLFNRIYNKIKNINVLRKETYHVAVVNNEIKFYNLSRKNYALLDGSLLKEYTILYMNNLIDQKSKALYEFYNNLEKITFFKKDLINLNGEISSHILNMRLNRFFNLKNQLYNLYNKFIDEQKVIHSFMSYFEYKDVNLSIKKRKKFKDILEVGRIINNIILDKATKNNLNQFFKKEEILIILQKFKIQDIINLSDDEFYYNILKMKNLRLSQLNKINNNHYGRLVKFYNHLSGDSVNEALEYKNQILVDESMHDQVVFIKNDLQKRKITDTKYQIKFLYYLYDDTKKNKETKNNLDKFLRNENVHSFQEETKSKRFFLKQEKKWLDLYYRKILLEFNNPKEQEVIG